MCKHFLTKIIKLFLNGFSTAINPNEMVFPGVIGLWLFFSVSRCSTAKNVQLHFCDQQKKVKFPFLLFHACLRSRGQRNDKSPFLYFLHTVNESYAIFLLSAFISTLFPLCDLSNSMCAVENHLEMCNCTLKPRGSLHFRSLELRFFTLKTLSFFSPFFRHRWRLNYTTLIFNLIKFPLKKVIKLLPFHQHFLFCINLQQPKCFLFPQVFFPVRFLFTLKHKKRRRCNLEFHKERAFWRRKKKK